MPGNQYYHLPNILHLYLQSPKSRGAVAYDSCSIFLGQCGHTQLKWRQSFFTSFLASVKQCLTMVAQVPFVFLPFSLRSYIQIHKRKTLDALMLQIINSRLISPSFMRKRRFIHRYLIVQLESVLVIPGSKQAAVQSGQYTSRGYITVRSVWQMAHKGKC
jgi:hypothetical protein